MRGKEVKMAERNTKFHSIADVVAKWNVNENSIIDLWLDNDIPLYISLQGVHCTLSCSVNQNNESILKDIEGNFDELFDGLSVHSSLALTECYICDGENREKEVIAGNDIYQGCLHSQTKTRQFRYEKGSEIKNISIGGGQLYYDGFAYGYWQVKSGLTTRFVKERYLVTNTNPFFANKDISSAITVIGKDDFDYLIFKDDFYLSNADFFVSSKDIEKLNSTLNELTPLKEELREQKSRISNPSRRALYILLNEYCVDNEGNLSPTTVVNILSALARKYNINDEFNDTTIGDWLNKSKLK